MNLDPVGGLPPFEDAWFNAQYNVRAAVVDHPAIFARWARQGETARRASHARCDLAYGPSAAERLDLFGVTDAQAPLLVFIHGGFWRSLDKSDFSWLAAPFNAQGIAVAILNYGLAPAISLEDIVRQNLRASDWLWRNARTLGFDRERMFVSGHSAGGHLGAMMLCARWQEWASDLPGHIYQGAMLLSGVYDLEPIRRAAYLNTDLQLTPERVARLSPLFMPASAAVPVLTAVGGLESDEFKRQTSEFNTVWQAQLRASIAAPLDHHLSLCERLVDPEHELFTSTVALCLG